ncbi:helix-turn-helix transcriptional regulator [Brevundimonas vesicularis]|uniref:LexA family transcriptional regulator n=1 Tax=Brevundimonas vesicularis TaxID=41276 RepID=UPI00384F7483
MDADKKIKERAARLRKSRKLAGVPSAAEAVRRFGFQKNSYPAHENGNATFSFDNAQEYAEAYRVSAEWLYSGKGPMVHGRPTRIPILGKVAAGFEGEFADDFAMGDADDWLEDAGVDVMIALRVEGDSMVPLAHDGDIAVFGAKRDNPQDLVNRRVMARLSDGRKLFKILRPGRKAGTYDLYSLNSAYDPIEDAKLEWVLPLERLHVR